MSTAPLSTPRISIRTALFIDKTDVCVIPPYSFALARTVEISPVPRDVLCTVLEVTYARCGIIVNVTPLEPGWEGHVTLEVPDDAAPCPHLRE